MEPRDPLAVLHESLRGSPIIWKGEYPYFIHPISDGIPRMDAEVLRATRDLIVESVDWTNIDLIVTVEAITDVVMIPTLVMNNTSKLKFSLLS